MFPLDDFLRCLQSLFCGSFFVPAHVLFWPTLWTSTSLSPKFFTKWMMWMASVTWFNTICSKPFPTGFPSETIGLQISKTLFPCNLVLSLNYESLQTFQFITHKFLYKEVGWLTTANLSTKLIPLPRVQEDLQYKGSSKCTPQKNTVHNS